MKFFNSNIKSNPTFIDSENQWLIDCNGKKYFDTWLGAGALILGHSGNNENYKIDMLPEGYQIKKEFGLLLEKLVDFKIGGIGFQTSGSSAITRAIRLSRAVTKREKIAVIASFWHGSDNEFLFKNNKEIITLGSTNNATDNVSWFSNVNQFINTKNLKEYAALLIEPYQGADPFYSQLNEINLESRDKLRELGVLIIHDEIITGFRECYGSCSESRRVNPDIVVFGKAIAFGFPVGVVVVSQEIIKSAKIDPFFWGGTFPCSPTQMKYIKAALKKYDEMNYEIINSNHKDLIELLNKNLPDNFRLSSGCCFSRILNKNTDNDARSFLQYNQDYENLRTKLLNNNKVYTSTNGLVFPSVFNVFKRN